MQGYKGNERAKSAPSLDKTTILAHIAWARHILALLAGLACGILGITGFPGVAIFGASNVLCVLAYYAFILGVDADEHGGHGQFTSESMMPALALFLISWIVSYNAVHDVMPTFSA